MSAGDATDAVRVQSIAGSTVAEIQPVPATTMLLKSSLRERLGTPTAFMRLVQGSRVLDDHDTLGDGPGNVTLVIDESPMWTWDVSGNPNRHLLTLEACPDGSIVSFVREDQDYVNVISQEPVRTGRHYFEFVMHKVGDEQWCGVSSHRSRAGYNGSKQGWFYYSGRRYRSSSGALHAPCERDKAASFERVVDGAVIGMLLDLDAGVLAFALDGRIQGACRVPVRPLYVTTSLDVEGDRVELRRVPLASGPQELMRICPADSMLEVADSVGMTDSDDDMPGEAALSDSDSDQL